MTDKRMKRATINEVRRITKGMSTWEVIATVIAGRRDQFFTDEGLERGLREALKENAPERRSIRRTLLSMSMGYLIYEPGDFTGYRVTNDGESIDSILWVLAERGYDSRRLERLQPVIDRIWEHAPYNDREYERRKDAP